MTIPERLLKKFHDAVYRRVYADDFTDSFIATQIQVLREQRGLNQGQLAELAGLWQSQVSKLEDIDNSSWNGRTLKKIAKAFDLRLVVRFESFGSILSEVDLHRLDLERNSFKDDLAFAAQSAGRLVPSDRRVAKMFEFLANRLPDNRSGFSGEVESDVA